MSRTEKAPGGVTGQWYVDSRCINCGASRHVAPDVVVEIGGMSVFQKQPQSPEEIEQAWLAGELCPTRSIRRVDQQKAPKTMYPHQLEPGIYLCGNNARASYGAHSYFIEHPGGNILFDSPSYTRSLARELERLGGIQRVILSHRDDVADAQKWAEHFAAPIYIHQYDQAAAPKATEIVQGESPAEATEIDSGLVLVPLPGHSKGSMALLVNDEALFTGDSLCWSEKAQGLHAFADFCWYSWDTQKRSLAGLQNYRFTQVFPGHGKWSPKLSHSQMRAHLAQLLAQLN